MYRGELFNSITHLVGTVMALIGTSVLLTAAIFNGADARQITALSVYGAMMIVLYLSSTLYHSLKGRPKQIFHVFDHCAIYLLIAGTYTPFTLVTLRGVWGWSLFAIVWALAAAGVAKDVFLHGRYLMGLPANRLLLELAALGGAQGLGDHDQRLALLHPVAQEGQLGADRDHPARLGRGDLGVAVDARDHAPDRLDARLDLALADDGGAHAEQELRLLGQGDRARARGGRARGGRGRRRAVVLVAVAAGEKRRQQGDLSWRKVPKPARDRRI